MSDLIILSDWVRRNRGVSENKLKEYDELVKSTFGVGKTIESSGHEFLKDFVSTLINLFVEAKKAKDKEKASNTKNENLVEKLRLRIAALETQIKTLEGASEEESDEEDEEIFSTEASQHEETEHESETRPRDLEPREVTRSGIQRINLNKLVKKPRYFDGQEPLPREWFEEFKDAREDNLWSEQTAVFYFKHFLKGDAATWFKLSVRPDLKENMSWKVIDKAFSDNYLGRAEEDRVRLLLKNLRMKPEDRVANFIPRVRQYLLILSPKLSEKDQVNRISDKLRAEYADAVVDKDPKTVDELRNVCRKVEAAADLRRSAYATTSNQKDRRIANREGTQKRALPFKKECYRCGRNTHLVGECRAFKHLNGTLLSPESAAKTNNYASRSVALPNSKPRTLKPSDREANDKVKIVCMVSNSPANKLIRAMIKLDNVSVYAVIDTGANVSIVNEQLTGMSKWNVEPPMEDLMTADGNGLKVIGSVVLNVQLELNGVLKSKYHRISVIRDLAVPFLMGNDLLSAFKVSVNCEKAELCFNASGTGIRTFTEVVLPPKSRSIVKASINAVGPVMTIPGHKAGILIANSVAEVRNGIVPIMILNITDSKLSLGSGYQLATFEPLELKNEVSNAVNATLTIPTSDELIRVGDQLETSQLNDLKELLERHKGAFSLRGELGCARRVKHSIDLEESAKPIAEPLRRRAQKHVEETSRQINKMLAEGIIEESSSPWASPYLLVKKKSGEYRLCIDFRKVNNLTKKNAYPLPNLEYCLDTLAGKKFYSQFDFCSGYWQMELDEKSKEITAFKTEDGLFQWNRMPFGLTNAPASFQKLMNTMLAGVRGLELQVYLDDVCLASESWEQHLDMLRKFFILVESENLKLKGSKCLLGVKEITFLGHKVSEKGIAQDPEKVKAIVKLPSPTDVNSVRRIMGLLSYYRRFVPNFAQLAHPLLELTRKNCTFHWSDDKERALRKLIQELVKHSTLTHFNNRDPVRVKTDASRQGIAGILLQLQQDEWKIVVCCSRRLSAAESNYGVTDLEGLAVVYTLEKLKPYLIGRKFELLTDHCALCILKKKSANSPRLQRWAILLSKFDFEIIYVKGKEHNDVDCLSRAPVDDAQDNYLDSYINYVLRPIDCEGFVELYTEDDAELIEKCRREEDGFILKQGLMYKDNKLYIPTSKRPEILTEAHESAMGGHGGIAVTLSKLEECWWPDMKREVELYVKGCEICQKRKAERALPAGTIQHFHYYEPWAAISVDTLGPLPETLRGNKYVLVLIDIFSKFMEAKAISDVQAAQCAEFLTDTFARFGPPRVMFSDNGPQFLNDLVQNTTKLFGVEHRWATADHSQGNAPVERAIQTLQEKLSINCATQLDWDNWDSVLPITVLAINSSVSKTTGYQPFELIFGKRFNVLRTKFNVNINPYELHLRVVKEQLKKLSCDAIESTTNAQNRNTRAFERNHRTREFEIGEKVVMRVPNKRRGKLDMRFLGPYQVLSRDRDIYVVREISTGKELTRHVESLKPFTERGNTVNSRIGLILSTLLILTCSQVIEAIRFDSEPPVIWQKTDKIVFSERVFFDIIIAFVNPCDSINSEANNFSNSTIHVPDDNGTSKQLNPRKALEAKCREAYHGKWEMAYDRVTVKCSDRLFSNEDPAHLLYNKRGWITSLAGGFAGGFAGFIVSDLVSTVWDYITPNSDHNRINRMEDKIENIKSHRAKELNAFKNVTRSIIGSTDTLSKEIINTKHELHQLVSDLPEFIWSSIRIMTHIEKASNLLGNIGDKCEQGMMDIEALAQLLQAENFKDIKPQTTQMIGINSAKAESLRIRFSAIKGSKDTRVYLSEAFQFWDQLGSMQPVLKKYVGADYVLFNHTADCAKGLKNFREKIIYERCANPRYRDSNLNRWESIRASSFTTREKQETQVKSDRQYNYVYCYPGNVLFKKVAMECPPNVFRLPLDVAFETSDFTYVPTNSNMSFHTKTDINWLIHSIHLNESSSNEEVELIRALEKSKEAENVLWNIENWGCSLDPGGSQIRLGSGEHP